MAKILIVDDAKFIRITLTNILKKEHENQYIFKINKNNNQKIIKFIKVNKVKARIYSSLFEKELRFGFSTVFVFISILK